MALAIDTTTASNNSEVTTTFGDAIVSSQITEVGQSTAQMTLDANGLFLNGDAEGLLISINQPDVMPFPLDFEAISMRAGYKFPILASEDPQDVGFDLGFTGLRFSPGIWELFDPAKKLPRDPIDLDLDIDGTVISGVDLPNILALEAVMEQNPPPVSVETLTLNNLVLGALGSSMTGTADFAFDNTDLDTFDGFPRPVGDAFFTVTGANAVIDRLIEAGAISESEASPMRLGIGMFARSTGEDRFETVVEINDEAHVSVNGQRIR
jgi:hypothetical protein